MNRGKKTRSGRAGTKERTCKYIQLKSDVFLNFMSFFNQQWNRPFWDAETTFSEVFLEVKNTVPSDLVTMVTHYYLNIPS